MPNQLKDLKLPEVNAEFSKSVIHISDTIKEIYLNTNPKYWKHLQLPSISVEMVNRGSNAITIDSNNSTYGTDYGNRLID